MAKSRIEDKAVGRYVGLSSVHQAPGGRAMVNARRRAIQPVAAAVEDPYGPTRIVVTVNRQVDILEQERSHGRLSEAAYRTGRTVQAVFERAGGLSGTNWCGTSRVDARLAQELKVIRSIETAQRIQALVAGIAQCLGMIDMRLLRRLLGDGMTFAQCAAIEGKSGERGSHYVAGRFRDALEELAVAWQSKGQVKPAPEDKHTARAASVAKLLAASAVKEGLIKKAP